MLCHEVTIPWLQLRWRVASGCLQELGHWRSMNAHLRFAEDLLMGAIAEQWPYGEGRRFTSGGPLTGGDMRSSGQFDVFVRPFAVAILPLAETLRGDSELSRYQRSRVRDAVVVLVRKACDVTIPAARLPEVSAEAARLAAEKGIDLREQTWHSQPKFDPRRAVFHYEHMTPVTAIVEKVVAEAVTTDAVADVLERTLRLAWITKIEDQELSRLGFKSKRPDPAAAYAAAGIELVGFAPAEPSPSEHVMPPLLRRRGPAVQPTRSTRLRAGTRAASSPWRRVRPFVSSRSVCACGEWSTSMMMPVPAYGASEPTRHYSTSKAAEN